MKPSSILKLAVLGAFGTIAYACTNSETTPPPNPDAQLFAEINESGYTYFQGGTLLTGMGPHGDIKLRFNATATGALDGTGELPSGNSFPTGSILVKEAHTNGSLTLYAVMKKDPSNSNAGSGWLWAEFSPSGGVVASVTLKGSGCVPCHSTAPHRDLSKTFDVH